MYLKTKLNVWGTLLTLLTLIIMFHIFNLNIGQETYNRYLDATELTNYTLLESLISVSKNASVSPEMTHYTPQSENRINFNLQSLTDLAATISLTSTYTVVLRYHDKDSLSTQLETILRQTYKPSSIYVIGDGPDMESTIDDDMIHFSSLSNDNKQWFTNVKESIQTDFVFVLDNHRVQPGTDYMEFILRLLNTPHFKHTFIGTESQCQSSFKQAHYVNKIQDIWAFSSEWFLELDQQHPSLALYQSLEIPSVRIPTLKNYPQLLGNTNPDYTTCQEQQEQGTVMFFVKEMTPEFNELLCQFNKKHPVVHLVSTAQIDSNPCSAQTDNVIIRHRISTVKNEFNHLVNVVSPRVVISKDDLEKDRLVSSIKQIQDTTYIRLSNVQDVSWMSNLSISSLSNWNTPKVKLIMTTSGNKKLDQVKRAFDSLQNANYLGDQVDLFMLMDEKSDVSTRKFINNADWSAGKKQIRHRISSVQPMQLFVESWYPSDDHEYAVLLDDRVELSPSFYVWIKQTLLKYKYDAVTNKQMFGISLYSPRVIDTDPSGRQLLMRTDTPYFMQVPFGAGALYFPEHWREFHDYMTARLTDQSIVKKKTGDRHLFKDSLLTNSRTDKWMNSWRKYFDEVINMRGYVMLYPSVSYSTLTLNTKKKDEMYSNLYHVPLSSSVSPQLPDMDSLPVLDYFGKTAKQDELIQRGHEIQSTFSACEPKLDHQHDASDMMCPFSHLIQIPIDKSQKDVPVLSVNLYSA